MDKNYNSYSISQLVEDRNFSDWVLKDINSPAWEDWMLAQSENRRTDILKAKELVSGLGHNNQTGDMDALLKTQLWDRINNSIQSSPRQQSKGKIVRMAAIISAIAASLAVLIIMKPFASTQVDVYAEVSQQIELPQASMIDLAQNGVVSYDTKTWKTERKVELKGEAFFNVTKGQPFIVKTSQGEVSVLGTSFNVDSGVDHLYVDVKTGKVKVSTSTKMEVLNPGDQYWLNPKMDELETAESREGISHYVFNNQKIGDILSILAQNYNLDIDVSAINKEAKATTYFNSKDDLKVAIEKVIFPLNLKFDIENNQVVIH